jgi:hypothetical protein
VGFGTIGTVKSVGSGSFVVNASFGNRSTTVKTTSATTYSTTTTGAASDVTSGTCVSAFGTKTTSGTVDAFTVTTSAPVNGKCSTIAAGFGSGFGGFAGRRPAGATANGSTGA